uniref:Transposase (Putative), gypsy type n=1 Tax=Tanacetum cinerariifolium TaxID=118510 RepID=A0A6L2NU13_TANCI|nr:hypothetical protein [Tanacetum cinerariifolium]
MSRDTIQLETAVSTISQEYLLEFTSEYSISEDLHPKLPGREERIVDFPEDMDLFNLISASNPSKVKTGLRPRAAHEVPLLTAISSRVIDMKDPDVATESSGTPSTIEKSPLDFDNENSSPPMTEGKDTEDQAHETVAPKISPPPGNMPATGAAPEVSLEEEVAAMGPRLSKKRGKRVNDGADANAPPKVLRKDYASVRPKQSTRRGKSLPMMGLAVGLTFVTPADTKGVSDPDPLSYAEPQPHPEQSMTQSFKIPTKNVATMEVQDTRSAKSAGSGKSTSSPSMVGSPGGIYQPGLGVTNNCRLDTPDACQDVVDHRVPPGYFSELRHMPNAEFLSQYNKNLAQQVAMGSQLRLRFEQETSNLKTLLEAEADMKKDVEAKNADLTKELESLRTQFLDLQVIGHGVRLAVMKCAESIELRQAFANVVSAGIAKGISEGLAHGIEHGKTGRGLKVVEAYDSEANSKYLQALQELKDLKYPIVDQLEGLKDDPMEVLDPRDPWAFKEEMLLEEAITANVSRAEKKKRCRVVCRIHGVGFAHHARSDGVPVSVPTVAPQDLVIPLADAATQTETSEDRSKSLPPMNNLDWP